MNGRAHTVSVVICCYASARFDNLRSAVDSVCRQTSPPTELAIVVDHNPMLLERVRAFAPDVLTIPNRGPAGLSGARNTGIAATRGGLVAFLDDDAVAEADWLEHLLVPYADGNVAGVGGAILADWQTGRPRWFPEEFDWVVGCTYRGLPTERARVRNLIGANMSFRRTVLEAAGGFAVEMGRTGSYPLGNDDTEFCIRVQQQLAGRMLLYEPSARVRHTVPPERSSWGYFRMRCFAEGLAKSDLARVCGTNAGLSSERAYVARSLPRGVARGLRDVFAAGDVGGIGRVLAIVAGLLVTAVGYATGRVRGFVASPRRGRWGNASRRDRASEPAALEVVDRQAAP